MTEPLLELNELGISFKSKRGMAAAVRGVSFNVAPGESVAVVGESGSGKSVTALGLLGLLPKSAKITGSAKFNGQELVGLDPSEMRRIRGKKISMIFQDPMTAFNPVYTIGEQIVEAMEVHGTAEGKAALTRAAELLEMVGVPEPGQRVNQYPHEFSGGMRQRAMIAMAISNSPDLLIADEPTTALDVTVQAQVMEVLAEIRQETGAAMILITHDLGLVAGAADRVQVMYGGRIFERGPTNEVFYNPRNPYTQGLMSSMPRVDAIGERLIPIDGSPPSIMNMPEGCAFAPRCRFRQDICTERSAVLEVVSEQHMTRCHLTDQLPTYVREGATA